MLGYPEYYRRHGFNPIRRGVDHPNSPPGFSAYYFPDKNHPIKASNGDQDGPGSNKAVYLTSYPPEVNKDNNFYRVWFQSLDSKYKLGWVDQKLRYGSDSLKIGDPRKLPQDIQRISARKLEQLNAATLLETLRVPPGNRLEALKNDRKGQHSIRINDQWRLCFVWRDGNAFDVEIVDYH